MDIKDSVSTLKGVGPKKQEALARLKIETIEDLLFFFPRSYEDWSRVYPINQLREDMSVAFKGTVELIVKNNFRYNRKQVLKLLVSDETDSVEVVFFNARYFMNSFKKGETYTFYGKLTVNQGRRQVIHPEYSKMADEDMTIQPVYPLTKGLSQNDIRKWQHEAESFYPEVEEYLRPDFMDKNKICDITYALENVHFPKDRNLLNQARYRLVFDELLILQTGLMAARSGNDSRIDGIAFNRDGSEEEYIAKVPYPLTGAQRRCVDEIVADLEGQRAMNRLLQGDVGSGKTLVAEIAMYKAVKSGYQAVMMAPTEILARQHFDGISKAFSQFGLNVGILTGSMKAAEKRETLEALADGTINILIGTHAVIQPNVEFNNLGLVITDEQHRFGVGQRIKLKEKGHNANILVMTATPIPRTLAVILYGDLDISIIDEMPPGRQKIDTKCVTAEDRNKCYSFVEKQLDAGRQAYVVTPLIEESEAIEARSAQEVYEELSARFFEHKVALIHGAMKQTEKDAVMDAFYKGEIDVLVATVVIEVGINVPNATVIVIENAERFGLAQLHQLRGRVGRGSDKSYCFLVLDATSEIAAKRGKIMEESNDGFYIAEEDLKLRGAGEIFGTRQHGLPDLNIADMAKHIKVLHHAREEAKKIVDADPMLKNPDNEPLRRRVVKLFGEDITLNL